MRDIELYQRILGLAEPWSVERVILDVAQKRVDIWIKHPDGQQWTCPRCQQPLSCYDHAQERVWRHLDTCQFQTHLHARIPRVRCPEHGIGNVTVPWAEAWSRFTMLMECLIIDVLQQCSTVTGACELLAVSWDEAFGVMQRAVVRGQGRKEDLPIPYLGVDEKAFRKGHSYMTVVCDLERSTVEYVGDDRTAESLAAYYQSLSPERRAGIQAVAMDMWEPYVKATTEWVPLSGLRIVFDRFHIMGHLNKAVDAVRRQEHRQLSAQANDLLKGTKYWWLYAEENVPDKHRAAFQSLRDLNLRTSRAWAIKETLRDLWNYRSEPWARRFFKRWFGWARRSKLPPVKKVAAMLNRHLKNILTYCVYPITNGVAEGLNSKIMTIKRKACGYRNKENFKRAIYFFCGGLDLYPR
jgi:transposase